MLPLRICFSQFFSPVFSSGNYRFTYFLTKKPGDFIVIPRVSSRLVLQANRWENTRVRNFAQQEILMGQKAINFAQQEISIRQI